MNVTYPDGLSEAEKYDHVTPAAEQLCRVRVCVCVCVCVCVSLCRVPTAPGKPGKTGPDLENPEKQGVLGQKPGKILQHLEKKLTSPQKSLKASTEKASEKI